MPMDFRARDGALLSQDEWSAVDLAVQDCARAQRIGRRVLSVFGPLGPGVDAVDGARLGPSLGAVISLSGEGAGPSPVATEARPALPLPLIHRDAILHWRDVQRSRQLGAPLDLTALIAAVAEVAAAEDGLIFRGERRLGIEGLLSAAGIQAQALSPWTAPGDAYAQLARAAELLAAAGHPGPYALVLSPAHFARLQQLTDLTGTLEIVALERLLRGAVLPCGAVPGAVLVDAGPANLDLAVGIELTVAQAGVEQLSPRLRVLQTVVPRIKRPSAILRLDPPGT